ncbi:zinc finger BED domain-containing protein 4-like [Hemicordylus capensis]|uniref:zinc finger BED domain-containing protein 4-like n=1 Tax=Hemicordylus capensis TaxID=884348 RepID=UPI00230273FF|nr:zinc finger BED domain-containing protein 4-like [Hemicordylus capensis]
MRHSSNSPKEAPFPENEDLELPMPLEQSPQALGTSRREESHTSPPTSLVPLQDLLGELCSLMLETESPDEQHCSSQERDVLCHTNPQDEVSVSPTQPKAAAPSVSYHGGDAGPMLYPTSAGPSNATFLGLQSAQALLRSTLESLAESSQILQPNERRNRSNLLLQNFIMGVRRKNVAVCKSCHKQVKIGREDGLAKLGAAPLLVHLLFYHPVIVSKIPTFQKRIAWAAAQLQTADEASVGERAHWGPTHPMVALLNTECTLMLVDGMFACKVVDKLCFRTYVSLLVPKWKMPQERFFSKQAMPALDKHIGDAINRELSKSPCPVVHFTIDGWASGPTTGYIFLIAHWVADNDGVLCRHQAALAIRDMKQSNFTEVISSNLITVRANWLHRLRLEIGYVVADNSTITKEVKDSCLGHVPPLDHCLNVLLRVVMAKVAVEDTAIAKLLHTLRDICRHFQQSQTATCLLCELHSKHDLPHEKLLQELPTTWQAILRMLQCLLAQERVFRPFLKEHTDLRLTAADWKLMHHLTHLLKPFDDTITMVRKKTANLGQILHQLYLLGSGIKGCLQQLQRLKDAAADAAVPFASELMQSLENSKHLRLIRENTLYQNATFLHPQFRECVFIYPKEDVERGRECVRERMILLTKEEYLRKLSSGHATSSSPRRTDPSKATEVARKELESYLQDEIDPTQLNLDPLVYWNAKRHTWPSLSVVALQYFSCPPTTVYSEMVFNISSCIQSDKLERDNSALISVNRDWRSAEFRVPPATAETMGAHPSTEGKEMESLLARVAD